MESQSPSEPPPSLRRRFQSRRPGHREGTLLDGHVVKKEKHMDDEEEELRNRRRLTTTRREGERNNICGGIEDGFESSRDAISSMSSYNPMDVNRTFGTSLSLQSARSLNRYISRRTMHKSIFKSGTSTALRF